MDAKTLVLFDRHATEYIERNKIPTRVRIGMETLARSLAREKSPLVVLQGSGLIRVGLEFIAHYREVAGRAGAAVAGVAKSMDFFVNKDPGLARELESKGMGPWLERLLEMVATDPAAALDEAAMILQRVEQVAEESIIARLRGQLAGSPHLREQFRQIVAELPGLETSQLRRKYLFTEGGKLVAQARREKELARDAARFRPPTQMEFGLPEGSRGGKGVPEEVRTRRRGKKRDRTAGGYKQRVDGGWGADVH